MGSIKAFSMEKLVIGILISEPALRERLLCELAGLFGPLDFTSQELEFTYSRYYDREMGGPIRRFFVCFHELVEPQRLSTLKRATNALEDRLRVEGRRKINLDPGLLSLNRFILASTKNSFHRIPLAEGIYGEITLIYQRGAFRPLEWTYPDYHSPEYLEILDSIRDLYRRQLKGQARTSG